LVLREVIVTQAYKNVSDKALQSALKALEKNYGKDFLDKGLASSEDKTIPTGHDELDCVLTKSHGGLYLSGICELFGAEAGGKTSLAMCIAGKAQKLGLHCMWVDAEHSFSVDLARVNQCDPDKMIFMNMTEGEGEETRILNAEEILDRIFKAIWSNVFSLIVVDSVAALMPERIATTEYVESKVPGEMGRIMSKHLPKIAAACGNKECTVIFINQIRNTFDQWKPTDTTSGRAIKFYASQRISVDKVGGKSGLISRKDENEKEEIVGHYARVKVIKNKKHVPYFDNLEIPIYYKEYLEDNAKKCFDLARKLQVISSRNGVLTWKKADDVILQAEGESEFLLLLRESANEGNLAQSCVEAGKLEKNKDKKSPTRIPQFVEKLAEKYLQESVSNNAIDQELGVTKKTKK